MILLRSADEVGGLRVGPLVERISLYADDTLLYLNDASDSLTAALRIIDEYGKFSGVKINWEKSNLFLLSNSAPPPSSPSPLQRISRFRYLGIEITGDLNFPISDREPISSSKDPDNEMPGMEVVTSDTGGTG